MLWCTEVRLFCFVHALTNRDTNMSLFTVLFGLENVMMSILLENSQHFVTQPLVSLQNDFWEMCTEIAHWWCVTTEMWVALIWLVMSHGKFASANQKYYLCQIWVVMRHQYGIFAAVAQMSFRWEASGGVVKCWLFSRASKSLHHELATCTCVRI